MADFERPVADPGTLPQGIRTMKPTEMPLTPSDDDGSEGTNAPVRYPDLNDPTIRSLPFMSLALAFAAIEQCRRVPAGIPVL